MSAVLKKSGSVPGPVKKIILNGILIFVLWFLFSHILCLRICHDQNLYPSVCDGDLLIALRTASPSPGDIIVLGREKGRAAVRYSEESDKDGMEGVVVFLVRRRGF